MMQRGTRLTHPPALEMPDGFDPSGIPCRESGTVRTRAASSHRRPHRTLPGLASTSRIATVMQVLPRETGDWLVWGCVEGRPALFAVEPGAAAEMMASVTAGEMPTAIIDPGQLLLEPLD